MKVSVFGHWKFWQKMTRVENWMRKFWSRWKGFDFFNNFLKSFPKFSKFHKVIFLWFNLINYQQFQMLMILLNIVFFNNSWLLNPPMHKKLLKIKWKPCIKFVNYSQLFLIWLLLVGSNFVIFNLNNFFFGIFFRKFFKN